jgi:hypothetical protein
MNLIHQEIGHVFIIYVQDQAGFVLVDSLWQVSSHHSIVDVVSTSREVLVNQIEGIPPKKDEFVLGFAFAIGCKSLVHELTDVKFNCRLKSFFLHPLAAISTRSETLVAADDLQIMDDFRPNQVSLS